MSTLNTLLANMDNLAEQAGLNERLELVAHKIKFMETMPVAVLDSLGNPSAHLGDFLVRAGAGFTADLEQAVYIIFYEEGKGLEDLMRVAPVNLQQTWPAAQFGRVCLLADDYNLEWPQDGVALVEDMSEMLHPGHFVYGAEGHKWIRFNV